MNPEIKRTSQDLFDRVLKQPPNERRSYLAANCPDDEVRAEVERLLAIDVELGGTKSLEASDPAPSSTAATQEYVREKGSIIASHFEIVELLGRGAMGEVYLASDRRLERRIALKFLSEAHARDPRLRARFFAEARAASALNHPNVCILHEVGELEDGSPFLALEYLEGGDLEARLSEGRVSLRDALAWSMQLADALDAAHSVGLIHRDIKPSNLHITPRGQLKILDFGLAKRFEGKALASDVSLPGSIVGTPLYMSPEQALGHPLDARSDLFSAGVVMYELLTGERPFSGDTFAEVAVQLVHLDPEPVSRRKPKVPRSVERIVETCMAKNPEERYPSARDLLVDLKRVSDGGDLRATPSEFVPSFVDSNVEQTTDLGVSADASGTGEPRGGDVFISYAAVDDHALPNDARGWITGFHRNLEVRIEQLTGERVRIWRSSLDSTRDGEASAEELDRARTVVSVVSPPYIKSPSCWEPVVQSHDESENSDDSARLFKVVKRPVPAAEIPPRLRRIFEGISGHEFFDIDPATGRVREYTETGAQTVAERYQERIYDLAEEISSALRDARESQIASASESGNQKTVYLATTTSDLRSERDRLRRELVARGHLVLPDRPLPLIGAELLSAVRLSLERADFSVHPVGSYLGVVPEGLDESVAELENRLAAERSRQAGLERLIWTPDVRKIDDSRQASWVENLRADPREQEGAELVEGSFEVFRGELVDLLTGKRRQTGAAGKSTGAPPQLFLLCVPDDERAVEPIEDFFFDRGVEVVLPAFADTERDQGELHVRRLTECDAVLVYFGAAERHWVEFMLRDVAKAAGYRDRGAIEHCVVYVAPPIDRRKERFRSLTADVVRAEGEFDPSALTEFAERLREGRS